MENIINSICEELVKSQIVSKQDVPIYQYGLKMLLLKMAYITSFIIYALLVGALKETILFLLTYSFLRSYSGGYHASSILRCYLVSLSTIILNSVLCKVSIAGILFKIDIVLLILSSIFIFLFSPVDNHEKQLDDLEKKVYGYRAKICVVCCFTVFIVLNVLNVTQTMVIAVSNAVIFESVMMVLGMIKNLRQ